MNRGTGLAVALAVFPVTFGGVASAPPPLVRSVEAAAPYQTEARTAAAHASYAADGSTASYVREHLGHVLACIEGSKGTHVNPAWENPCAGQGNGLLVDLQREREGAAWTLVAQAADDLAVAGLNAPTLDQGKMAARGVTRLMTLIAEGR